MGAPDRTTIETSSTSGPGGEVLTRYRKRAIGPPQLQLIRDKIEEHGDRPRSRKAIATAICEAWDWRQPRGNLATRACSDLLLRLQDWGHIKLPPTRAGTGRPRPRYPVLPDDLISLTGLEVRDEDADLDSLVVRPITPEERAGWCLYMGRYHYLGYRAMVGEHLLYAAFLGGELVAVLGWASAAFRAPLREAYVGWDEPTKREHLHLVADNVRFLILPWVRVRHLASKILAFNLRRLSADWEQMWGHPIHLAETFVDTARFRGTCYRAANWVHLGQTAGRSKRGNAYRPGTAKALFVYPLRRDARRLLGARNPTSADTSAQGTPSGPSMVEGLLPIEAGHGAAPEEHAPDAQAPKPNPRNLIIATSAMMALGLGQPARDSGTDGAMISHRTEPDEPRTESGQGGPVRSRAHAERGGPKRARLRIDLTDDEKADLEVLARGLAFPHRMVVRAKAILLVAAGETFSAAAKKIGRGRKNVRKWAERFVRKRLRGLEDALRTGRPARFPPGGRVALGQARLRAPGQRGPLAVAVDLRGARAHAEAGRHRRYDLTAVGPADPVLEQAQAVESSPLAQLGGTARRGLSGDSAEHPGSIHASAPSL